jgi:hypothetical protein
MNPATLGSAAWLGAVTGDDHPWWMPLEDVALHRRATDMEAERIRREQKQREEDAADVLRERLHKVRVVEAVTGRKAVPTVGEVMAREDERSDRAMAREELAVQVASGQVTNLDAAPVPARRPAEVQQVADARGAREARELGAHLAANGQALAGGMFAELGKTEGKRS